MTQLTMKLRRPVRVECIQMADMPRYHYDVWCGFDDGDAEPLCSSYMVGDGDDSEVRRDYVRGLRNAIEQAVERWGAGIPIEVSRSRGRSVLIGQRVTQ